tara:strand:- start:3337 stop:4071 length:735 start_codon:yes stop_codon:yes gene_type:complete
MKKIKHIIIDNVKTLFYALIIAILIRSLFFQPFYIPSSSMEPSLLVGDRIFVSKYDYGYSKHSFPFSPGIFSDRLFYNEPKQGDLVVFKTPADNRTDYIKRLIGMPGDVIQFKKGEIFINEKKIKRKKNELYKKINCGNTDFEVVSYEETLPNGIKHLAVYSSEMSLQNTDKFKVPQNHFFLMGDNRDCSRDSRFLSDVGYVNYVNLVGKARYIFFSNDTKISPIMKFWNISKSFRLNRLFKKL